MEDFGPALADPKHLSLNGQLTCPICNSKIKIEFPSPLGPPENSAHSGEPFFREVSPEINDREFSPELSTVFRNLETDEEIYNHFGDIYKILGIDVYWFKNGTFVEPTREQIVASYNLYKKRNMNLDTESDINVFLFETLLDDAFRSGYNKHYLKYFKPKYAGTTRNASESLWGIGGKRYKHFAKSHKKRKTARRKKGTKRHR